MHRLIHFRYLNAIQIRNTLLHNALGALSKFLR